MKPREIEAPFGPLYPALPSVKKFRKAAKSGLNALSVEQRRAYGEAVETAIKALQRSELQRELPTHNVNCSSGTNHNTGAAIHKAMRTKHRAALAACPAQVRRARSAAEWQAMYDAAMAEKRARETVPLAA